MSHYILVVNPGSTSTKIGVFADETLLFDKTLRHTAAEISAFASIPEQKTWRRGLVLDALVYGSQQSNSSANGTIASPELAVLEGDQRGGGCIAVAPGPVPAWMLARNPELAKRRVQSLVRVPDGADTDNLCEDFRLSGFPTPGGKNRLEK